MSKERLELTTKARPVGAARAGARRKWRPPKLDGDDPEWPEERWEALAYVLGWILKGDASTFRSRARRRSGKWHTVYRVEFKNKNLRAIEMANSAMAKVLGRRPVKVHFDDDEEIYEVTYRAEDFVVWFERQTLESLRPYIEHSKETMKAFVKGYSDSDGSVCGYKVYLCGAADHRDVLEYARRLCQRLGMRVGEVRPYAEAGEVSTINERAVISQQRKLRFSINATDFLRVIGGFNHSDRDRKLKETIKGRRWTPWPAEVYREAIKLYKQGLGYKRIAKLLGVPSSTVYYWLKRGTRCWQEYAER